MNNSIVFDFQAEMKKKRLDRVKKRLHQSVFCGVVFSLFMAAYIISVRDEVIPNTHWVQLPEEIIVDGSSDAVVLKPDSQGHFVFVGYINGKKVKFLYDTGATSISVPVGVATYLGLTRGVSYQTKTANGIGQSYRTKIDTVKIGSIEIENIGAGISQGLKGDTILLGMSFLKHLEIKQTENSLTFVYERE